MPYGHGTGLIYRIFRDDVPHLFIVTNRHVIEDAEEGIIASEVCMDLILKGADGSPDLGKTVRFEVENVREVFTFPPNPLVDIAAAPLLAVTGEDYATLDAKFYFHELSLDIVPTESDLDYIDAIENVIFIGYPNGLFDTFNKTPIARRGSMATPIQWSWQGERKFLIDASVFPGSSGSPVFIDQLNGYRQGGGFLVGASRVLFAGILSTVYRRGADVEYGVSRRLPITGVNEVLDLGIVYRWELIEETIDAALKLPTND